MPLTIGNITVRISTRNSRSSVVVAIDDGEVLDGDFPGAKMKLVQAWLEIHREDLTADWNLAVQGMPPQRIKPLD